jgi:hypothetical protein
MVFSIAVELRWVLSWREVDVHISASFGIIKDIKLFGFLVVVYLTTPLV